MGRNQEGGGKMNGLSFVCGKCGEETFFQPGKAMNLTCQHCGNLQVKFKRSIMRAPVRVDGSVGRKQSVVKGDLVDVVHDECPGLGRYVWVVWGVYPDCIRCGEPCLSEPVDGLCADCQYLREKEKQDEELEQEEQQPEITPIPDEGESARPIRRRMSI